MFFRKPHKGAEKQNREREGAEQGKMWPQVRFTCTPGEVLAIETTAKLLLLEIRGLG